MPKKECQYCGKRENTDWDLAGFVCSECRPSCPTCGEAGKGFPASRYSTVKYNGEKMMWCASCAQLIPPEFVERDPPVRDKDFTDDYQDLVGLTIYDSDNVPVDAEGIKDVPTYDAP